MMVFVRVPVLQWCLSCSAIQPRTQSVRSVEPFGLEDSIVGCWDTCCGHHQPHKKLGASASGEASFHERILDKKDDDSETKTTAAKDDETPWATSYYEAPSHVRQKRVDKITGKTNFITTFFICPVGVGRSRFMAASI